MGRGVEERGGMSSVSLSGYLLLSYLLGDDPGFLGDKSCCQGDRDLDFRGGGGE